MTYNDRSIEIIRPTSPPPKMTKSAYARWRRQFGELMGELRRLARRIVGDTQGGELVELLEAATRHTHDAVSAGLVEHLWEFTAFHVPGPSGRTLAECALNGAEHLPEGPRAWLGELAGSHWELFEVLGDDAGAVSLRRLFDDRIVALQAVERPQPFLCASVVALRLFDAGGFWAAPVALLPEPTGLAQLMSRLELEWDAQVGASRADFMRRRGSALILGEVIARHKRRVLERRPMPEPQVSLAESPLGARQWRRLHEAFSLVERGIEGLSAHGEPLVIVLPGGRVFCVEKVADKAAATLFDSASHYQRWREIRRAETAKLSAEPPPFCRLWRASADELFPEDLALLEAIDLDPLADGAAVAIRLQDDGLWYDLDRETLEELVEVCHLAALRLQLGEGLAA